jgi:UBX domain-containing protein 1
MVSAWRMANSDVTTTPPKLRFFPRSTPGTDFYSFRDSLLFLMMSVASRAPPSILNVLPGQPVEVRVTRRTEEDYVSTPRRGFGGPGSRLGGVVPDSESVSAVAPQVVGMPGAFPSSITSAPRLASASASAAPPPSSRTRDPESVATRFSVDQTKPTTSVQVRLADGTRFARSP